MKFDTAEARRILRLEANVRDIYEQLSKLQERTSKQHSDQQTCQSKHHTDHQTTNVQPNINDKYKNRKINSSLFDSIGSGKKKRVILHPVSPMTQAVERAKGLLVYKRRLGNLQKRRKLSKPRKLRKRKKKTL